MTRGGGWPPQRPGAGGGSGMSDFPGLVRTPSPSPEAPTELPEGVTERIVVMVAVLTHSTPAQIRIAHSPTPMGGWQASAVYNGADVATAIGRKPDEALIALEQRVARDAKVQCDALLNMLDAWEARTKGPTVVPYEREE